METHFVVILTFLFMLRFGTSSNTMIMNSSNVTCIESERRSLIIFKQSLTNGVNRLSTWSGLECCEWQGVRCDRRDGHVVKLDLRNPVSFTGETSYNNGNWLGGELSPSLVNLKHLRYLDLSMNNFSGFIPEFLGSFTRLKYLNLSCSGFRDVIPHHLGNLSRLQYLDLNYIVERNEIRDRYSGISVLYMDDISWASSLSSIKHLDLSGVIIGRRIDWFKSVNMLPSLLTLKLAFCRTNLPKSVKFVNLTSLNSLDLSTNIISTTVPFWLSNLTSLTHLNLQYNFIHGQIPDSLGTLTSLASIDLSTNSFSTLMPRLFWNMSSLVYLDLSTNRFHGSVPQDVRLCNLSVLNLSNNEFEGDLSSFIGNAFDCSLNISKNPNLGSMSSLRELDIHGNELNGSIPESFGQLLNLEKLNLRTNYLSGGIPKSLAQLSKLQRLEVSYNSLVGILSEDYFTKLTNLTFLSLTSNSLALNVSSQWIPPFQLQRLSVGSCNIGPRFPNWLQTQTNLQILELSNSSIIDTIPEWFENISSSIYYLDLSHNQIHGKLPLFRNSSNIPWPFYRYLKMNSNKFDGSFTSLPSNLRLLDLEDNSLTGNVPQIDETMNPDLSIINLSKNRFTGSIPMHLCKVLTLEVLDLSQNKFSGRLPRCLGNLNRLNVLDLSGNTITGVIPSSLGSLEDLRSLHLHNNKFEGNLPVSLQNLTGLVTFDLSNNLLMGSIPLWIGENLWSLNLLNLQSNKFTGKIPLELCKLTDLQLLNLAQNNISGTIPRCFGNLSGMMRNRELLGYTDEYYEENMLASMKGMRLLYTTTIPFLTSLDLSSNNINGEIPDVLTNLVGLKNLNLSRNMLKGQIPMKIGNLKQVESLDLSMNKLSGRIPSSLSSLNYMSYLNLSFNNLSGPIPTGNQIQTLNDPSIYEGNNGLCGPPVSRSCKGNDTSNNNNNQVGGDESGNDNEHLWLYAGMGPGFFVGFVGLIGSLHFIRSWRVSYFKFLENVYGWLTLVILLNLARLRSKFF